MLALMSSAAGAAQWTITPHVAWGANYQDNPQLALQDSQATGAASLDARATLTRVAEATQFSAAPRISAVRYPEDRQLDNYGRGLALAYQYESERNTWSIAGDTARDSTLTTELEDTGFVQERKWRPSWNISPTWSRVWSDSVSGQISVGYSDVAYEDAPLLADYSYRNINAGVNWESGERAQWGASLTAARLDAPIYRNISDDYGVQVSFAFAWSDTQRLKVSGGARSNDLQLAPPGRQRIHEQARGWTLDAAYDVELEFNTWHAQATRSVDPSGVGVLVQKDKLLFTLAHWFTEQVSGGLSLTLLQTEELQREKFSARRRYARTGMQVNWVWTPTWTLGAGYGYTQQQYEGDDVAQAHSVQFTLTWQGEPKNFGAPANRNLPSNDDGTEY